MHSANTMHYDILRTLWSNVGVERSVNRKKDINIKRVWDRQMDLQNIVEWFESLLAILYIILYFFLEKSYLFVYKYFVRLF